jgi:hypothetical protein
MVANAGDAYLPLKALSQYSGLGVRTLRGYLQHAASPLPHFRIGGKILVKRSEYDAWVARFRASTSSAVDALVAETLKGL